MEMKENFVSTTQRREKNLKFTIIENGMELEKKKAAKQCLNVHGYLGNLI